MGFRRKDAERLREFVLALDEPAQAALYRQVVIGSRKPSHVSDELWKRLESMSQAEIADLVDDLQDSVNTSGRLVQSLLGENRQLRKVVYADG